MTASLYIIGAGGLGRDALGYARELGRDDNGATFTVAGFLDDRPDALAGFDVGTRVVSSLSNHVVDSSARYLIAIGEPRARYRIATQLEAHGATFVTLIHPKAHLAPGATVGRGCIIAPFAFVGPSARIDDHVVINTYASAAHDAQIGKYVVFSPYAGITGTVTVEDGVFFGTHTTVAPGLRIGAWSKLGAGAVALHDMEPGTLAYGTPARGSVKFAPP